LFRALLAALLVLGAVTHADEPKSAPRPPPQQQQEKPAKEKLSAEDEALVKDLAVLENVDLLKDLDLFEGKEQAGAPKDAAQRQQ